MKALKLSVASCGLELSSVVRLSALVDVFRFLLILGPMIALFHACTNIYPMHPKGDPITSNYVLYRGNRSNLTKIEAKMLWRVQKYCGKEYRNNLPKIWKVSRSTLMKSLYLGGISAVLPTVSAVIFLVVQKKDTIASIAAVLHFTFEIVSICFGIFAAWFISDKRLCFLDSFSGRVRVPIMFWSFVVIATVTYKAAVLYCLDLYIKTHCKSVSHYRNPSPEEELKAYLKELKALGIPPRVKIDLPADPAKRDWSYVKSQIKKLLQEVRIQIAELHKDDPLVGSLLKSGKLKSSRPRKREKTSARPSVIQIAKKMKSEHSEYKLLKHHHHHHGAHSSGDEGKDEMEIILPEPDLRYDPDPLDV